MKTIKHYFKLLAVLCAFAVVTKTHAQGCVANFTYTQLAGGLVNFQSTSIGVNSVTTNYNWNFGNGQTANGINLVSPSTTYTSNGNYLAILTITSGTLCNSTFSTLISVTNATPCNLNAGYTFTQGLNGLVNFVSTSTGTNPTTSYTWASNGSPFAAGLNVTQASKTYTANGNYFVQLTLQQNNNLGCMDTVAQLITINTVTNPCQLSAGFNYTQQNGLVNFNNQSSGTVGGTTYNWNFGDNTSSNVASPAHTYTANGSYIVTLTVNNNFSVACISTHTQQVIITNAGCNLVANFSYAQGANGLVTFTSTSLGTNPATTGYSWTSNGLSFAAGLNATLVSKTYTANGTYFVMLTIGTNSNMACQDTLGMQIVVTTASVNPCLLNANFNSNLGANGLVNFNNLSVGTTSNTTYLWNFGDNTTSNTASPAHTYSANGVYLVTLTANNNFVPACVSTKTAFVVVSSLCNLSANFTSFNGANGLVNFTNITSGGIGAKTYTWNFGDGFSSNTTHPSHTYISAGIYNVTLLAKDTTNCTSSTTKTVNISNIPCIANANFTLAPTNVPKFWIAIPSFPWNVVAATWSWGDGASTNSLYASHQYSVAGTYTICLTVTVSCGATASTCSSYFVNRSSSTQSMDMINISVVAPETVDQEVGLLDVRGDNTSYNVYPNPSQGSVNLSIEGLSNGNVTILVQNLLGEVIYQTNTVTNNGTIEKNIDLSNAPKGVYFVKLNSQNQSYTRKIVINK